MSLNSVTVTITEQDASGGAAAGNVVIAPTSVVTAAGVTVVSQVPVVRALGGSPTSVSLVATDTPGTSPGAGFWAYSFTLPGGSPQLYLVPFANGSTQRFDQLVPVIGVVTYAADPAAVAYVPLSGAVMLGQLSPRVATLSQSGGNVTPDWSQGNVLDLTLTASGWEILNPVNPVNGQVVRYRIRQDGTGSRTLAGWGSAYDWGSGNSAPSLTSGQASVEDELAFEWDSGLGVSGRAKYLAAPFPQAYGA